MAKTDIWVYTHWKGMTQPKLIGSLSADLGKTGQQDSVLNIDDIGQLWIAKFPAKNDTIDKAAWEYLTYRLAIKSGIKMSDCKVEQIYGPFS